jgi:hypothetical protein
MSALKVTGESRLEKGIKQQCDGKEKQENG